MLNNKLEQYDIILASGSPRRQELLNGLNIKFRIEKREIEENYPPYLHGSEITDYLSELKASPFEDELLKNQLLITADTVVRLNGKILGKPKDKDEAINMLSELSDTGHEVITSVSLTSYKKQKTFNDTSIVYFKKLSDEEINYYVDNYKPFDKAGAYGIQEWLGYIAINKLEGSYYNVMGFPVHKFYKEIMNF